MTAPAIACFDADLPHGITLSCRATDMHRKAAPRVMLLHGFPEAAFVWDDVMTALAPQAHCIAPNLRGYERSSAPAAVADYRARHLVSDIAALIDHQCGGQLDLLVAHDWGGAVAWALAAQQPQRIRRLLVINSPHPATFLRELRDNPAQQSASAYMNFLCRPDAATLLAENDFARLWPFFNGRDGASWLDVAMRERYRAVWRHGLDAALNYYRASPLRPPLGADDAIHRLVLPHDLVTVEVPTTVLWGEADSALPTALLDGLGAYVPRLDVQRVAGASHWIVHEEGRFVVATIERLLATA